MLFIYAMWDSENQRLGFRACTPVGYCLRGLAEMIGFVGPVFLIGTPIYTLYRVAVHSSLWRLCWLFAIPFGLGIVSQLLMWASWRLAVRKQFRYDYETRTIRWIEGGSERLFPDTKQADGGVASPPKIV